MVRGAELPSVAHTAHKIKCFIQCWQAVSARRRRWRRAVKIYDLTVPIRPGMPVYPGDPDVEIELWQGIQQGGQANVSLLRMGAHTGTHVDAPSHFYPGARGVDAIPLDVLVGPAVVVELAVPDAIAPGDLQVAMPPGTQRLLLKTRNSALWERTGFQEDFVYLTGEAARWLVDQGVKLVGIDYLSVDQTAASRPEAHLVLLGAGLVVLEGLDLEHVPPGRYTLMCLPLKVQGADGAPARAVLVEE